MFGKADSRDAEIAFLRDLVKRLQDQVIVLTDTRAASILAQKDRPQPVIMPAAPRPMATPRPMGVQGIRESGVRLVDGKIIDERDDRINESFEIR